jgi:hypothetical protein
MKKLLLFGLMTSSLFGHAQTTADQQTNPYTEPFHQPTSYNYHESKSYTLSGNTVLPCDSGSTTLSVTGACSYEWFSDSLATNLIISNSDLVTPMLYNDTTFYLGINDPGSSTLAPMPAQSGTFSNNARGYFFTAPVNFTFTAFYVPTSASTGNMNVGVVRLNTPPPLFSSTTNDFTTLGYWPQSTDDTIYTCIPIQAGDIIGILGTRGADINSYAPSPSTTTIDGNTVSIERLGMQFGLATTPPQDLFTETNGNISRVEFLYSTTSSTNLVPVEITVPQSYSAQIDHSICQGDSVNIGGNYVSSAGTYFENLQTLEGCDSTITHDVSIIPVDVSGSLSGITMTANATGVTYQWVDCANGFASIAGETNQTFTATNNGSYAVIINDGACSDTSECWTVDIIGLTELPGDNIQVYPNPTTHELSILSNFDMTEYDLSIRDMFGRVVLNNSEMNGTKGTITVSSLSAGSYYLLLKDDNHLVRKLFVKK